jgi:hypothetical protein
VIVSPDGARIREQGRADEHVAFDDLLARLSR